MLQIDFKTVGYFEKNANNHGEQCFTFYLIDWGKVLRFKQWISFYLKLT